MSADRNKIEELLQKTVNDRERKKEAFDKKREELREKSREKFMTKLAKIENARKRKQEVVENIRKSVSSAMKNKQTHQNKNKRMIDKKINKVINMISNVTEDDWFKEKPNGSTGEESKRKADNYEKPTPSNESTSSEEDEFSIHKQIWKILRPKEKTSESLDNPLVQNNEI